MFFFSSRRLHTRSLCDWSSDVCSSDLFHQESPVPLGTRQFGVFGFLVAAFFRVTALAARFPAAEALLSGTVENKAVHAVAQIAREFQHLFGGSRQFGRSEEHTSELQSHSDLVCR